MADNNAEIQKIVNARYPDGRPKENTITVDFHKLEAVRRKLQDFEVEYLTAIRISPEKTALQMDFNAVVAELTDLDKRIIELKKDGYTEKEIAAETGMSRRTIIRKLNAVYRKVRKIIGTL